jgi:hypothetical protein
MLQKLRRTRCFVREERNIPKKVRRMFDSRAPKMYHTAFRKPQLILYQTTRTPTFLRLSLQARRRVSTMPRTRTKKPTTRPITRFRSSHLQMKDRLSLSTNFTKQIHVQFFHLSICIGTGPNLVVSNEMNERRIAEDTTYFGFQLVRLHKVPSF